MAGKPIFGWCFNLNANTLTLSTMAAVPILIALVAIHYYAYINGLINMPTSSSDLEPWALALIIVASTIVGLYLLWRFVLLLSPSWYRGMIKDNSVSVDDFVGGAPSPVSALKSWLLNRLNVGRRVAKKEGYALKTEDSDKLPGLKVTSRSENGVSSSDDKSTLPPIIVGTIRMGFGHHRIAYAATSWGLGSDSERETWFHDFLNIDSEEAQMIKDTDKLYSKGSRMASELGGTVEKFWGSLTKSGDEDSLRVTYQFSEHMIPLINDLDKNSPIIATHSMVACAAVAAGFKNVINLVIDNHAQWFVVVPGALNLVQGPSNYHSFLKMGVPEEQLALAGHWIPRDLVEGIPEACARRTARRKAGKPLRIIVPVGGAGAQRKFIVEMVGAFSGLVKEGKVQLFLNAADHEHMKKAFVGALERNGLDYDTVVDMKGVQEFRKRMLTEEPEKNVTLVSLVCSHLLMLANGLLLTLRTITFFSSSRTMTTSRLSPRRIFFATLPMFLHANLVSWHSIPFQSS
jgi:hypothetical protein